MISLNHKGHNFDTVSNLINMQASTNCNNIKSLISVHQNKVKFVSISFKLKVGSVFYNLYNSTSIFRQYSANIIFSVIYYIFS